MHGEQMPDRGSADEVVLTHVLEKLRARDGVTLRRLEAAQGVAAPLLSLPAVRRYASFHHVDATTAARAVVVECVRDALTGTERIVADAVLALGAFADTYYRNTIESRVVEALRSSLLSRRREALLANWDRLHAAVGAAPADAPSDRTLRGALEGDALFELARQLIRGEAYSLGPARGADRDHGYGSEKIPASDVRGRVIVVGGAVMDATFRTKSLPERDTSNEAYGFDLSAGGKGLTQAVAAARLGLDVSLLAAVADDRFGDEIVEYLQREGVDTSMLKHVTDARTPFTGVIEFELGDNIAVNWRNEREVRLDIRDVERFESQLLASDAVLVTFELPRESMQRTLELAHTAEASGPLKIVTPAHPYSDGSVSAQALAKIDYLVAHPWELGRYAPPDRAMFDLDAVARRVMAYGVETLCIPTGGGCTIYSETPMGTFAVPTFPSAYKESQAARDAFCAALAAQLIDSQGEFSEHVALWATAAMAAATADYPMANSMPDRPRVEQLLSRSRFAVTPRGERLSGGQDAGVPATGQAPVDR
jgi:ribokinase